MDKMMFIRSIACIKLCFTPVKNTTILSGLIFITLMFIRKNTIKCSEDVALWKKR